MKGVLAHFVLKFPNFRYHGNEGHARVNSNDAIKLHNLENPLLGTNFHACDQSCEVWMVGCVFGWRRLSYWTTLNVITISGGLRYFGP